MRASGRARDHACSEPSSGEIPRRKRLEPSRAVAGSPAALGQLPRRPVALRHRLSAALPRQLGTRHPVAAG